MKIDHTKLVKKLFNDSFETKAEWTENREDLVGDDDDDDEAKYEDEGCGFYLEFFSKKKHTGVELENCFGQFNDVLMGFHSFYDGGKFTLVDGHENRKPSQLYLEFFKAILTHVEACGETNKVIKMHQKWQAAEAA